ncbi:MAG TPA: HAD family hydrolase [Candidatus Dormibacteraeota bacterium]|nr:HAD family hydrolase [Candidatus Dormibacteraeota bacterium]
MSDDRWATFDCYGTLVDWDAGILSAIESVAPGHGRELLARYHGLEPRVQAEPGVFKRYREIMRETLSRAAAESGVALAPGDEDVLGRTLPDWPIFPDVVPALEGLRRAGWRLAILSNVDNDLIAGTLRRIPVEVDLVVTAEDVRSYKPHPGHLLRFRELTGATADRWVHVAASMFHDIVPASELGIRGVYVTRGREKEHCRLAEAVLPNLVALPAVLDSLVSPAD